MAAKAVEYAQAKSLKLKLTGELPLDAERVRAVRKARPDAWMGVDANQGFTPASLTALMPDLVACKVKLVEQPFARGREADLDGLPLPDPGRRRRERAGARRTSSRWSAASTSSTSSSTSAAASPRASRWWPRHGASASA